MLKNEIKRLADELINQIKAGEVVERPYNVVKEIVENALDAGSKKIHVELLDGGKQLIRISDDGIGISRKDLPIALERHATSKINNFTDLESLTSFGFRGEALPSIASVSHFSIKSRIKEQELGREIIINCGKKLTEKDVAMPIGTLVQIKDLFGGVPVRLKFLKSTATEFSHIHDFLIAISLAFYKTSFRLTHNGREVFHYHEKKRVNERFTEIIGFDSKDFVEVNFTRGSFKITGFVGLPHTAKTTPSHFITFVNGRYVKDKIIRSGVIQAYQGLLLKGLVAPAIVFVQVDPSWVDVNAHPSKVEVRFYDTAVIQDLVSMGIQNTIKDAIHRKTNQTLEKDKEPYHFESSAKVQAVIKNNFLSNESSFIEEKNDENSAKSFTNINKFDLKKDYNVYPKGNYVGKLKTDDNTFEKRSIIQASESSLIKAEENKKETKLFEEIKTSIFDSAHYLGQFANCFLLLEISKELWIVDQHAFHERILFEEIIVSHSSNNIARQELISPLIIPSTHIITNIIIEQKHKIAALGFNIEGLKNGHIAIHSYPSFLTTQKVPEIFDEIIARIISLSGIPQTEIHPLIDKAHRAHKEINELNMHAQALDNLKVYHLLFATMACHSAIRAGDPLNEELVKRLLSRTKDVDFYAHCPHGRPVIRKFTEKDISTWFQRT